MLADARIGFRQCVRFLDEVRALAHGAQMRKIGRDILHPVIDLIVEPRHLERDQETAPSKYGQEKDEADDQNHVVEQEIGIIMG